MSISVGTQLYSGKIPSPYVKKAFDIPFSLEYQKRKKKGIYSVGVQFYHTYYNVYFDNDINELLAKTCNSKPSNQFFSEVPNCCYYFTTNTTALRIPLSYTHIISSSTTFQWFVKTGVSINFNLFNHRNVTYAELDPQTGALLNQGPFNRKYHFWRFNYQSDTAFIGSGINYQLSRKVGLVAQIQYQKSYEGLSFKQTSFQDKLFLELGTCIKLR